MSGSSDKSRRWRIGIVMFFLWLIVSPVIVELTDGALRGILQDFGVFTFDIDYGRNLSRLINENHRKVLFSVLTVMYTIGLFNLLYKVRPRISDGETVQVANGIRIPAPAGSGEHGTAWFMSDKEMDDVFAKAIYSGKQTIKGLSKNAGIIIDYQKDGAKEIIRYLDKAVNAIVLGATRSGKSRRLLMTSIWLNLLAGINMLVVDVKGEMFAYLHKFAELLGYEVRTINYRNPEKSMHYNYMAEINQLLREKRIPEAVNKAWDIVSVLVGEPKGERIWNDGQCATIAAAILIIGQDAPEWAKNLTNVYYFLAYMCEPDPETGAMPINDYLENLPSNHPARGAFQIAKIAPFRTRSSFFTSALATLRLFTDWNVADVTSFSDYGFADTDDKKVITFIVLPDENPTYHPLGAIFIKQYYESLVKIASTKGGKLDRKFIFYEDEIGNFPTIPGKGTMLSAGAGRNIFFVIVLQDFQQLEKNYKEDYKNIRKNSQLTICLKVTDEDAEEISKLKLGTYTIKVNSANTSVSDGARDNVNYSSGASLTGRPLLYGEEISRIESPDALIIYEGKKAITNLPDLSHYYANKELGLGDEDFNKELFIKRMDEIPSREIKEPRLWTVWEDYGSSYREVEVDENEYEDKVSFLA